MAIIQLPLMTSFTYEEATRIAKTADGLSPQSRREVRDCLDMVQIWHDWITDTFGEVRQINHKSTPDDPPDLELTFNGPQGRRA